MILLDDWALSSDQPLYFCRGYVENGRREGECQVEICPGPEFKASVNPNVIKNQRAGSLW